MEHRILPLLVCVAIAIGAEAFAQDASPTARPLSLDELNSRGVMGRLGIPLGNSTEVVATIVSGDTLRMKALTSAYLLQIDSVGGSKVADKPLMRFIVPAFAGVRLANDHFSLFEMLNGRKAGSLESSEIAKLEKGYVGKSVKLTVYESGGFDGVPKLPKDFVLWQGTRFHFSTHLVVLKQSD